LGKWHRRILGLHEACRLRLAAPIGPRIDADDLNAAAAELE
jgi:hypothetical protein